MVKIVLLLLRAILDNCRNIHAVVLLRFSFYSRRTEIKLSSYFIQRKLAYFLVLRLCKNSFSYIILL